MAAVVLLRSVGCASALVFMQGVSVVEGSIHECTLNSTWDANRVQKWSVKVLLLLGWRVERKSRRIRLSLKGFGK